MFFKDVFGASSFVVFLVSFVAVSSKSRAVPIWPTRWFHLSACYGASSHARLRTQAFQRRIRDAESRLERRYWTQKHLVTSAAT